MNSRIFAAAALAATLAACATTPAPAGSRAIAALTYETGPCFGACPVYRVTVGADGTGIFEGRRFTAASGERRFMLTPAQFRAFAQHLAPLRPSEGEVRYAGQACNMTATDMPSADVIWRTEGEAEQRLHFYYGCDMQANRAIAERLRAAPALLPIADLIGTR